MHLWREKKKAQPILKLLKNTENPLGEEILSYGLVKGSNYRIPLSERDRRGIKALYGCVYKYGLDAKFLGGMI